MRASLLFCCLIISVSAFVAKAQIVTEGLVSYYTMDKKDIDDKILKDVFGGKHGTILGDPESIEGPLGEALEFGGDPDSVELPPIMAIEEDPVTYECWFNKPEITPFQCFMSNKTDFNSNFFRLQFNNNTGQLRFYTEHENEQNVLIHSNEEYVDGEWHHLVATREGDKGKMYVDGVLADEGAAMPGNIGDGKTNWYLAQNGQGGAHFVGALDEVRFYKRALTEEEAKQNFESKVSGFAVSDNSDGLTVLWGMIKKER